MDTQVHSFQFIVSLKQLHYPLIFSFSVLGYPYLQLTENITREIQEMKSLHAGISDRQGGGRTGPALPGAEQGGEC